ncbi:hypothetical protein [Clostridium sp. ZS2-4]|uniref:hypothetical protein n=1 Tax=Clostridium sp. ZS2-4 TaxID=2987703 RepID=UPI00227B3E28|nr:hypothetical protein [Clostridium sp. ZS2-4]MCY6354022.1 hypothetical protein [Clostridium sp. ZS2-4]
MFTTIILFITGTLLIFLNIRAINKEKNSFSGILSETSSNMKDFEVEIGKLRREFAETILELQTEISDLEKKLEENSSINHNTYIEEHNGIDKKNLDKELEYHKDTKEIYDKKNIDIEKNNTNMENDENKTEDRNDKRIKEKNNSIKIKEIEKLMEKGLSIEEIADSLKISKGEILLIKELYLE